MRRRRRYRPAARHGLQHIGDLLPQLMMELQQDLADNEPEDALEDRGSARAMVTAGGPDSQTTFGFYQGMEVTQ